MKNFIVTLITISTFCFSTLLADADSIDERKIDIYFGNGVWNTSEQAEESQEELSIEIKDVFIKNDSKLAEKNVVLKF